MELPSYRMVQRGGLDEPGLEISQPECRVPPPLPVPIERIDRILRRQRAAALASMVVDRPQGPHAAIGNIGAVRLTDLFVPLNHQRRIVAEISQCSILPIIHQPFDVIAVIFDRPGPRPFRSICASR